MNEEIGNRVLNYECGNYCPQSVHAPINFVLIMFWNNGETCLPCVETDNGVYSAVFDSFQDAYIYASSISRDYSVPVMVSW